MKFGGVLVLICLTIFANTGRKFCREADQKLEDLANKIEELDVQIWVLQVQNCCVLASFFYTPSHLAL